jgi:hypothetical protein
MLFSYVTLCDYFPLYEFQSDQCFSSSRGDNNTNTSINDVEKRSTSNLTINGKNSSSKYNLQLRYRPSTTELILILWVFTLFCEELRQVKRSFFLISSIIFV